VVETIELLRRTSVLLALIWEDEWFDSMHACIQQGTHSCLIT